MKVRPELAEEDVVVRSPEAGGKDMQAELVGALVLPAAAAGGLVAPMKVETPPPLPHESE